MKKNERIEAFVETLGAAEATGLPGLDRCYLGYFECFNRQLYYEAHDVLEHLWLQHREPRGENYDFFKGLIQVAGAFVHLKKQYLRPEHPKDGRRLRPAFRLFGLAAANLDRYRPLHLSLDVEGLYRFCQAQAEAIHRSGYTVNPWRPDRAPNLSLRE